MNEMISVIVPVYNVEKYLSRCMESILKQTYTNMEIILINDGSTDCSGEICKYYGELDARIRVINKENGGLSSARNTGLNSARGQYVAFVDSDDYISENFIEEMIHILRTENVDIVQCKMAMGNEENYEFPNGACSSIVYSNIEYLRNMYSIEAFDGSPFKVYRKDVFKNIRFPEGRCCEDVATTYRLVYAAKRVALYPKQLYYYYQSSDSIMRGKYKLDKANKLLSFEERLDFFLNIGERRLYERALQQYIAVLLREYWLVKSSYHREKIAKEIKKKIRNVLKEIKKAKYISYYFKVGARMATMFPFVSGAICNIIMK